MSSAGATWVTAKGIPGVILDVLESHFGDWFTLRELEPFVAELRPELHDLHPRTIQKAVERLTRRGMIETRQGPRDRCLHVRVAWRGYWEPSEPRPAYLGAR